jgi:hypothetical protein
MPCAQYSGMYMHRDTKAHNLLIQYVIGKWPVPEAAPSKAWVCGCSLSKIVVSNPIGVMDVCLLYVLCVVKSRSMRRTDHSSRGVLLTVVCRCV